MNYLKRNLLRLALILLPGVAAAQTSIKGKVLDSESGEALIEGSVAVMTADTSRMVTGAVTGRDGSFTLKNVDDGRYVLRMSYVGYHTLYRAMRVRRADNKGTLQLGTLMMTSTDVMLSGAIVTPEVREVEVKEDTLLYNAAAFKVPPGSVLEDLIKKLPGVEVTDGTIKVNGKTVNRILVEGKEFFGNDREMSMKNLPSEMVEKIKTYDKQSDFTRITGIDDGNEETVIDLSVKKEMKQGWGGNVDAGYGTERLYSVRSTVRRFTDSMQGMLVENISNNGNNGRSTNGQTAGQLTYFNKKIEVGGNVRFNHGRSTTWTRSSSQNFVSTASSFNNNWSDNRNRNHNLNADLRVEWKIDSLTTLLFTPRVTWGGNESSGNNLSATFNDDPYIHYAGAAGGEVADPLNQMDEIDDAIKINENESHNWSEGTNYNAGGNLTLNRRLGGKPWFGPGAVSGTNGRNVSIRLNGTWSGNKNDNTNYSNVTYHQRGDSTHLTYRFRNNPSDNKNYSLGLTYSEPLMRNLVAQLNYSYNYSKQHSDGKTYDIARADSIGQALGRELWENYGQFGLTPPDYSGFIDDSLSRYTDNINKTHNVEFSLRYFTQLLNINAGVRVERQNQTMKYQYQGLDTVASRNFSRVSPTLNARIRFTKQHTLRVRYRGNSSQPDITSLFNLTDNSNPLNIREGNPGLKPSFTHNINIDYNNYFEATRRSISGQVSFNTTRNSISNRTEYNPETGGQTTRPENINGNWSVSGNIGFNTPLGWEKLTLNTNTSASLNNNVSYIYQNRTTLKNNVKDTRLGENLNITLRLDNFDIRASGNINWSKAESELIAASNQNTYNFRYGLSSTGNFPSGFGYSTDINMNSRRGYSSASMNTNELIWNAQVSYRFLRDKTATVSLRAYDILNRRSNISRTINAYSRRDSETNSIYSYVMAHLQWRFNVVGSRSARRQMRESAASDGGASPRAGRDFRLGGGGERGFAR